MSRFNPVVVSENRLLFALIMDTERMDLSITGIRVVETIAKTQIGDDAAYAQFGDCCANAPC